MQYINNAKAGKLSLPGGSEEETPLKDQESLENTLT
jgi:hypothetical protein